MDALIFFDMLITKSSDGRSLRQCGRLINHLAASCQGMK
jgi:hypothetical protein